VGDVEHAGIAAHGVVFLDLGAVMQGHGPAAEVHHAGAGFQVFLIQRGLLAHGSGSLENEKGVADAFHIDHPSVLKPERLNRVAVLPFGGPRAATALQSRYG